MISGWITNKGEILECPIWEHFKADNDIIKAVWKEYTDQLCEIQDECDSLADAGEHPEWHNYEMALDNFQDNALEKLHKLGFLRLGKMSNKIVVSGYAQWIEQHKYVLKSLKDEFGCELDIRKK